MSLQSCVGTSVYPGCPGRRSANTVLVVVMSGSHRAPVLETAVDYLVGSRYSRPSAPELACSRPLQTR